MSTSVSDQLDLLDLHKLTLEQLRDLRNRVDDYFSTWFGFTRESKAKQTPEWIEQARWRLAGKTEPCCECGNDYPTEDLHFHGEIYCQECRKKEKEGRR